MTLSADCLTTRKKSWALRQQLRELAGTLDLYLEGGAPWMASNRNMADAYNTLLQDVLSLWGEVAEDETAERHARAGWVDWQEAEQECAAKVRAIDAAIEAITPRILPAREHPEKAQQERAANLGAIAAALEKAQEW